MTTPKTKLNENTLRAHTLSAPRGERQLSAGDSVFMCGVGSVGRPLVERLTTLAVAHLTLVDFQRYSPTSVATQCDPADVGQWKVDVVEAMARGNGLATAAYSADIFSVPDGVVRDGSLVISCADNTRTLIGANRLAARMQCPLLKVNIEPLCDCVSVRAYPACCAATACAECQLSDRHYAHQTHPHSCDAATSQRHTAGSRTLAAAAADLSSHAARDILSGSPAADTWFGWETLLDVRTHRVTRSRLEPYEQCRWDHDTRWTNVFRLRESPAELRLKQLVPLPFRRPESDVLFEFDHAVTRWCSCDRCQRRVRTTRWFADLTGPLDACPACGHSLRPFPFGTRRQATRRQLHDVWDLPLGVWGVAPGAVIRVTAGGHVRTFVVGEPPQAERYPAASEGQPT